MKKDVKLTKHSKDRFNQRTDFNETVRQQNAKKAFRSGYEFSNFVDPVYSFLKGICYESGRYVAKIYKDYIYIFNNENGHRLLTVYKVPDQYLPLDKYLIKNEELARCWIALENKATGELSYWSECGGIAENLEDILEFRNQIAAENYINNNMELKKYRKDYKITVM